MTQTTLYWLVWGIGLVFVGVVLFATREIRELRKRAGGTLSETVERAIKKSPVLWWSVLLSMVVLTIGWGLTTIHWYTGLF